MTLRRVTAVASDNSRRRVGATRLVSRAAPAALDRTAWQTSDELRRAPNEETLRAFRDADRFPTFKIVRRPGAR